MEVFFIVFLCLQLKDLVFTPKQYHVRTMGREVGVGGNPIRIFDEFGVEI